jgi:hypothetical protein
MSDNKTFPYPVGMKGRLTLDVEKLRRSNIAEGDRGRECVVERVHDSKMWGVVKVFDGFQNRWAVLHDEFIPHEEN